MSVKKRGNTYHYEFEIAGRRFRGTCQTSNERAAKAFEKERKDEARGVIRDEKHKGKVAGGSMTLRDAIDKFCLERCRDPNFKYLIELPLNLMAERIGDDTLLSAVNDAIVSDLIERRRNTKRRGKGGVMQYVSVASVNRYVTEPLRRLMRRAAKGWKMQVGEVDWSEHHLKEPKDRVRAATIAQEQAFMAALGEGYREVVEFALLTGRRKRECLLTWDNIDFGERIYRFIAKGGEPKEEPLTPEIRDLLFPLRGHHERCVFTYVERWSKARCPITYSGLTTAYWTALEVAGIKDFTFHDLRHTFATRTLRETGDLALVQDLLGHSDPKTTRKYAHVLVEDKRRGLEAMAKARRALLDATPHNKEATG